jgi:hypothetical protein
MKQVDEAEKERAKWQKEAEKWKRECQMLKEELSIMGDSQKKPSKKPLTKSHGVTPKAG